MNKWDSSGLINSSFTEIFKNQRENSQTEKQNHSTGLKHRGIQIQVDACQGCAFGQQPAGHRGRIWQRHEKGYCSQMCSRTSATSPNAADSYSAQCEHSKGLEA